MPNPLEQLPWTAFERLSWTAKSWVVCGVAVTIGFFLGAALLGPIVARDSADNAAAVSERFSRRTVDPNVKYPEPSPFRASTPDFGPNQGPALGTYARQQARREVGGRGSLSELQPNAGETFGLPSVRETVGSAPSSGRARDRHTGVSY
jgi:hypothetical protein